MHYFIDPGCAVDIPAILYSLSFAPNPEFTTLYPSQREILAYMMSVADRFDVTRHIVCSTEWERADWQSESSTWNVRFRDRSTGDIFTQECKVLISAVGGLTNPTPCDIPGCETFKGRIVHTARWEHDVCLREKNVVVIGNGCKSIISVL